MNVGDTCFIITRDAAWTIVQSSVDRVSRNGRFVNVNGYAGQSYLAGEDVFPSYEQARAAAIAERDRLVKLAEQGRLRLDARRLARLKALTWEPAP